MRTFASLRIEWIKLKFRIDELGLKERLYLLAGIVFILFITWFFLVCRLQAKHLKETQMNIDTQTLQTETFKHKRQNIEQLISDNSVAKLLNKYREIQQKMQNLEHKIARYKQRFISEEELVKVLNAILQVSDKVTIIDFFNASYHTRGTTGEITPEQASILNPSAPPPPSNTAEQSNHSLIMVDNGRLPLERFEYSLKLEGTYFSILAYLEKLERIPWQLYWDRMEYTVTNYPLGTATIWFYTLKPVILTPPDSPPGPPK